MKKALVIVLILGLAGAGAYGVYHQFFSGEGSGTERVSSDSEDAIYVDSVSAITGYGSGNGLIMRFGGEIEPQATLEVKLESDRTVEECFVKEGDQVKEGQRLFIYDTQEDEDSLAQAEIDLERLEADIEVSQQQIEQLEKEKKSASSDDQLSIATDIMSLQTSIKKSEYEIKSKKLEMERLKETISTATVSAEMAGVVQKISDSSSSDTYSYSYSSDSSSAYITILAEGDFRVKGSANEQAVNQNMIYSGMPVIVYSRVDENQTWQGMVTEVDTSNKEESSSDSMSYYYGSSSGESSTYSFYVELDNSEGLILGQHVYIEENVGQEEQVDGLWLEEHYIFEEDGKYFVWKANNSNVIEKQELTLGEYDEESMKYEVLEGLDAEDYIAYPQDSVTEGTPVIYNDYTSSEDYLEEDMEYDMEYENPDELYFDSDEEDLGADLFDLDEGSEYGAPEEYLEEGVYLDAEGVVEEDMSADEYYEDDIYEDEFYEDEFYEDEYSEDDDMVYELDEEVPDDGTTVE